MPTLESPAGIPDQTGRTAIITGGSSGIGRAAAAALAAKGARVIIAVRDQEKGRAAAAEIDGRVEVRSLDLASLASVRSFARGVEDMVDILVNNAGTMTDRLRHTGDGFESQLGINHLGHFALTNLLLDRIVGRVVTLSSTAYRAARIDFDDLQWERRDYSPFGAYGQSKLAGMLFTAELQRRLTAVGSAVIATAAHPGLGRDRIPDHDGQPVLRPGPGREHPGAGAGPAGRRPVDAVGRRRRRRPGRQLRGAEPPRRGTRPGHPDQPRGERRRRRDGEAALGGLRTAHRDPLSPGRWLSGGSALIEELRQGIARRDELLDAPTLGVGIW
jgi:NAD(P)-dependent dehydrogenase (short-subunit alcohol dehydrogenase family)